MEKHSFTSLIKAALRFLRSLVISILGGAVMGIIAAVVSSFLHVER